jgi:hypothetical protein
VSKWLVIEGGIIDHDTIRTAVNAELKSCGSNGRLFSGADMRRLSCAVRFVDDFSGETAPRRVADQSQLSFKVSDDDLQLDMTAVDWSELVSKDPEGASSWWATVMEP